MTIYCLRPSDHLTRLMLALYLGACLILWLLPIQLWLKGLGIVCTLFHFRNTWHYYLKLTDISSTVAFWREKTGEWKLTNPQGCIEPAILLNNSVCSLHFILLNFRLVHVPEGPRLKRSRKATLIIMSDSLSEDAFKSLKQLLLSNMDPANKV